MKNILTKVGYMAFGSLLTLIGYHFGNIDNNTADAQITLPDIENAIIHDEIRCRKLVIVGDDNTPRITLWKTVIDSGMMQIYDEEGTSRVRLGVASSDNNNDIGVLQIRARELGGSAVFLGSDANGGFMSLYNKVSDKPILQTGITNKGEGFILTRDKVGYNTWNAGGGTGSFRSISKRSYGLEDALSELEEK